MVISYNNVELDRSQIFRDNKGKTLSAETIAKLSEAHKGKTHSVNTKAKISEAYTGKVLSIETRALMSKTHTGKTQSIESRDKRSATLGIPIYVYDSESILINSIAKRAAGFFNCSDLTIVEYKIINYSNLNGTYLFMENYQLVVAKTLHLRIS